MPSNLSRRKRSRTRPSGEIWTYFNDDYDLTPMEALLLSNNEERELWGTWGPAVLEKWIRERPGLRPALWWKFSAPRLPAKGTGTFYDGKLLDPRQRVGGVGQTQWGAGENWLPSYKCGIPASRECWKFFDPADPPKYEAQAVYLKRHGFLTPEEAEALRDRPDAWEPEIVQFTTDKKGD